MDFDIINVKEITNNVYLIKNGVLVNNSVEGVWLNRYGGTSSSTYRPYWTLIENDKTKVSYQSINNTFRISNLYEVEQLGTSLWYGIGYNIGVKLKNKFTVPSTAKLIMEGNVHIEFVLTQQGSFSGGWAGLTGIFNYNDLKSTGTNADHFGEGNHFNTYAVKIGNPSYSNFTLDTTFKGSPASNITNNYLGWGVYMYARYVGGGYITKNSYVDIKNIYYEK